MDGRPDLPRDDTESSTRQWDPEESTRSSTSITDRNLPTTDGRNASNEGGTEREPRSSSASGATLDLLATISQRGADATSDDQTFEFEGRLPFDGVLPDFRAYGYDIVGILGRGGMGVVYKAYQHRLDRIVALKTLPPAFASDPSMLQRMRNEVAILAGLSDTRVLEIYDVFDASGVPVLVMPYIDGPDLGKVIESRRRERKDDSKHDSKSSRWNRSLPGDREYLQAILPLLDQLVAAVAALHEARVIHRDIKPSNVLVDMRANVRLSDFGLAREGMGVGFTQSGAALGTRGFMSPEQWQGSPNVDQRSDVFGLGATLYLALTLELPYGRERIDFRSPLPKPPSQILGLLTSDEDAVILKALEPDPKDRFTSATEFFDEWHRVRSGLGTRIRRLGPLQRAARWVRRHSGQVAYLGTLLFLVSALAVLWALYPEKILDEHDRRKVTITTDLPGARFAAVALDGLAGPAHPPPASSGETTPSDVWLKPGDYLIVVEWPDRRFHEVYRHVPVVGEKPRMPWNHVNWSGDDNSKIVLDQIRVPPQGVEDDMALIEGTDLFSPGMDPVTKLPLRKRAIDAFYLDTTEVTNLKYASIRGEPPPRGPGEPAPGPGEDDYAVRWVQFHDAMYVAERLGKRLPDEYEALYAAKNVGQDTYPWGNNEPPRWDGVAAFGPVKSFAFDKTTRTKKPVFGLFSNVAEWTSSFSTAEWDRPLPALESNAQDLYHIVIKGAPPSAVEGRVPSAAELELGPAARHMETRDDNFKPGLGFRCARSARPRYLTPRR